VEVRSETSSRCDVDRKRERNEDPAGLHGFPFGIAEGTVTGSAERKHDCKQGKHTEAEDQAIWAHPKADPEHLIENGTDEAERCESRPAAAARDREKGEIEDENVTKKPDRVVGVARHEKRRRKAANQAEHRDQ